MELHIDRDAEGSVLFRFDPRVKLVCIFALIVLVSMVTDASALAFALLFAVLLLAFSRVPPVQLARGYLAALPFIALSSLTMLLASGPGSAMAMALRVSTSVLLLLLLVRTTPFMDLLWALRWFKVPALLTDMIMLTYRFIFVLLEELERMRLARKARGFQGGRSLLARKAFQVLANTIGMVFLRSYRRAGQVYAALLSRGYDGKARTIATYRVGGRDLALGIVFVITGVWTLALQMGWYVWP